MKNHVLCMLLLGAAAVAPVISACPSARAEDTFYQRAGMTLSEEQPPAPGDSSDVPWRSWQLADVMHPYVVLDGEGEAYVSIEGPNRWRAIPTLPPVNVTVRAPKGKDVVGTIVAPRGNLSGMAKVRFTIKASAADDKLHDAFYTAKENHYARLLRLGGPGAAWFRHQRDQAVKARTGKAADPAAQDPNAVRVRQAQLDSTYAIFTGGRAMSENIQLDRLLQVRQGGVELVDVGSLPGITVNEIDWKPLIAGKNPKKDALAAAIPADQHALFFQSFSALIAMIDEADAHGTPVLRMLDSRSEDARTRDRYQRQLCLSLDAMARLLGPQSVAGVALTGSDPYLRTGSDVAVLFEAKVPAALLAYVKARQQAAAAENPQAKPVDGATGGVAYSGIRSPDRGICSYVAVVDRVVVVTNSPVQLARVVGTIQGKIDSLGSLDEFTFFRDRYPLDDPQETGLLIVSDATLRRWCGPRWRIGTSRRTRASAVMADVQADNIDRLVGGKLEPAIVQTPFHVPGEGELRVTAAGVRSSVYGTLEFNTPIVELDLDRVTKTEAEAYRRFRDSYQRRWRQFYDPIAVRFSVGDERIEADVTVMPLIASSDYREFIRLVGDKELGPDDGDRHPEALLHWIMALDTKATMMRTVGNFLTVFAPDRGNPLGWMGDSVELFIDDDPFWKELAEKTDLDELEDVIEENYWRIPVGVRVEVESTLKATLFLTALRGYIEQSAPDMVEWTTHRHNGASYVRITPQDVDEQLENLAIYYTVAPDGLVVSIHEGVIKRALDRQAARKTAKKEGADPPVFGPEWQGKSMALRVDPRASGLLSAFAGENYRRVAQRRAWSVLPILNEWHRRFGDVDPVALHEKFWQTRIVCPGGGQFVWNEEFQSMESTVFGHPARPKDVGTADLLPLPPGTSADFGVTFENGGLRARAAIDRPKEK